MENSSSMERIVVIEYKGDHYSFRNDSELAPLVYPVRKSEFRFITQEQLKSLMNQKESEVQALLGQIWNNVAIK